MNLIKDGGQAFPVPMFTRQADGQPMSAGDFFEGGNGMTLRDWFAGMALQGVLAHIIGVENGTPNKYASRSYEYADAMLSARERKEGA